MFTKKYFTTLFVLGAILLTMSGLWPHAQGVRGILGDIGWIGFMLVVLTLVVSAVAALVRSRTSQPGA